VSDLVTIGYPDATTARQVLQALDRLPVEGAIDVHDAEIANGGPTGRWSTALDSPGRAGNRRERADRRPDRHAALRAAARGSVGRGRRGDPRRPAGPRSTTTSSNISDDPSRREAPQYLLANVATPETVLATLGQHSGRVLQSTLSAEAEQRLCGALQGRTPDQGR
jgi:hypothetical protein